MAIGLGIVMSIRGFPVGDKANRWTIDFGLVSLSKADSEGGEGVVAGSLDEMSGVVEGKNANVARAAYLKSVDAAV